MKKLVHLKTRLDIPIYKCAVWLVVSPELAKARASMNGLFGLVDVTDDYQALCAWNSCGSFGLFFNNDSLSVEVVSHEVFHCTHRVMDWVNANFDSTHHEQAALLHGYLMNRVARALRVPLKIT